MWWYASRAVAGSPGLMISGEGKRSGISVLGTESRVSILRPERCEARSTSLRKLLTLPQGSGFRLTSWGEKAF